MIEPKSIPCANPVNDIPANLEDIEAAELWGEDEDRPGPIISFGILISVAIVLALFVHAVIRNGW